MPPSEDIEDLIALAKQHIVETRATPSEEEINHINEFCLELNLQSGRTYYSIGSIYSIYLQWSCHKYNKTIFKRLACFKFKNSNKNGRIYLHLKKGDFEKLIKPLKELNEFKKSASEKGQKSS